MRQKQAKKEIKMIVDMIDMQKKLDTDIYTSKGKVYSRELTRMALLDELGEFNHEAKKEWCWWKDTCKDVDREQLLEELVDCWHFVLSIYYHDSVEVSVYADGLPFITTYDAPNYFKISASFGVGAYHEEEFESIPDIYTSLVGGECLIEAIVALTYAYDFTIDDVYDMYKKKNAVNHNRLESGY